MRVIRLAGWIVAASLIVAGMAQVRWPAAHRIANTITAETPGPVNGARTERTRNTAGRNDPRPPTDQQWANVLQWMKQHSPHRLAFLQAFMSRDRAQFQNARQLIWNEYRSIQAVSYPPLRQAMVAQAESQDQVFGAQIALRQARQAGNADQQDAARQALKAAVGTLVDGEQTVMEARIQKLHRDLDRLKENRDRRVQRIYRQKLGQAGGIRTQEAAPPPENPPG